MTGTVYERIQREPDAMGTDIGNRYSELMSNRATWEAEKRELRNYIFATDTTKTTNSKSIWSNKTTVPKLCQIRDNLHANYMEALFPNEQFFKWEGATQEDATGPKRLAIEAYIRNKLKMSNFIDTVSKLVYDYIDYGNAFSDIDFVTEYVEDEETGEQIVGYIGPRLIRLSPMELIFNPTAATFKDSYKITRVVKTLGELKTDAAKFPDKQYNLDAVQQIESGRKAFQGMSTADQAKVEAYYIDGFGTLATYYESDFTELLEFEGTIHNPVTGKLEENRIITVMDRQWVVRNVANPSWLGSSAKQHASWRKRPDNLYGMGPLDNLVGMQYRIDHLENLRADVFDLIAYPPLKVRGNVEEFVWQPNEVIFLGDDGDVDMLRPDTTALNADFQIQNYEDKMELLAGAPREAMGIRSPGEKTAFEVERLDTAASRIFQNKVAQFEREVIEPTLLHFLEISRRNMNRPEVVRIMDDDLGVEAFIQVTKEDITANGKLVPMGARHFAARNQLIQNLNGIVNSGMAPLVAPHMSGKALASLLNEQFGFDKYGLFSDNVAVFEQMETQRLVQQGQENLAVEQATPLEDENEAIA